MKGCTGCAGLPAPPPQVTNLEALHVPWVPGDMELQLCRYDWLNHWPLVIEFYPHPISPPWRSGAKNSHPQIIRLFPLEAHSILKLSWCFQPLVISLTSKTDTLTWCGGDVAQWYSVSLTSTRPCIWSPTSHTYTHTHTHTHCKKICSYNSLHSGSYKDFGSSVPWTRGRNQTYISYYVIGKFTKVILTMKYTGSVTWKVFLRCDKFWAWCHLFWVCCCTRVCGYAHTHVQTVKIFFCK
jgi:hypothetical protein